MPEWIKELRGWFKAVLVWWFKSVGGSVVAVFQILYALKYKEAPPMISWWLLGVCFIAASFLAWRDKNKKAELLEELTKSKIAVTCGRKVEMSILTANKTTFFRARLDLIGIEPVRNVEAAIVSIKREGKKLPLNEAVRLMLHPGFGSLDELREGTPEFVDVLKVEPDGKLALALIGHYPAVDTYCCDESGRTYELDVSITGSTRTRMCTFVFVWTGNRDTAEFALKQEQSVS